jgi:hypothetical protein
MQLSQSRAYEVLAYCYNLQDSSTYRPWLENHLRANGMAFSKMINLQTARRVEFVIQMKSEDNIYKVLEKRKKGESK